ncbi:acyl-CoA dehydrogenase family protein [Rhodococcus pyridinivorans]
MASVTLERRIFDAEHEAFRETVRRFVDTDIAPQLDAWARAGRVDRDIYRKAGKLGLLGVSAPERFGGGGVVDYRFSAIVTEELARVGAQALVMNLSGVNDLVIPYFETLGTDEQNQRWLVPLIAGDAIGAIAMTEPGAGSDLAAITTTATPNGDGFILNGTKTFISNGIIADTIIVVARTDPSAGRNGMSLLVVESDMTGFTRLGPLDKVGLTAQDTAELVFDNVYIPRANLLGSENQGFSYLRHNLAIERLCIAVMSMALMRRAFDLALSHSMSRKAFGSRVIDFQANRFYLAELATEIEVAQTFVDRCIVDASTGALDEVTAAMAKWWITELHLKVVHRAVQLHGGYGYTKEYEIGRAYLDSRVTTIFGGTTEIMKEIIGRRLAR